MKSHWFGAAVVGAVAHLTAVGAFAADLPPAPVYTKGACRGTLQLDRLLYRREWRLRLE